MRLSSYQNNVQTTLIVFVKAAPNFTGNYDSEMDLMTFKCR